MKICSWLLPVLVLAHGATARLPDGVRGQWILMSKGEPFAFSCQGGPFGPQTYPSAPPFGENLAIDFQ